MSKLVFHTAFAVIIMVAQLPAMRCTVIDYSRHCATQFALVTQSCSLVFPRAVKDSLATSQDQAQPNHGEDPDHRHDEHHHDEHHHDEEHHHDDEHHDKDHDHDHDDDHHHGHHDEDPHEHSVKDECCKWLNELDPGCVCDQLLHLPIFLSKLNHAYVLEVDDECKVAYECGAALV